MSTFQCQYCNRTFVRRYGLSRHLNGRCKGHLFPDLKIEHLEQQIVLLQEQTTDLKQKPSISVSNVLQVICISNKDNYLDMLTDRMGNFHQAIEYIRECALSDVAGDCKLIEKIYLSPGNNNISFLDRTRNRVVYFNEQRERVVENKDNFGRKLANNLQNSYLKGITCLLDHNVRRGNAVLDASLPPGGLKGGESPLENHEVMGRNYISSPSPTDHTSHDPEDRVPIDGYDIHTWNTHIYNLSDRVYQRRIVNQLNLGEPS